MNNYPVLVVAAYNRVQPIKRVLTSLSQAIYPKTDIKLIISIDNDGTQSSEVEKFAKEFQWQFGDKEVIFHDKNLGIRDHFNFCGDLCLKYGSVVFIEDDLFVSPNFYSFVLQALHKFSDDPNVAGISLFNYQRIEKWKNPFPFMAINDGADNYFLQQASWGQIWTKEMWEPYKEWYKTYGNMEYINGMKELPFVIKGWPSTSWKKHYIAYMILHNKYYVFPHISMCSNFDDPGTNRKAKTVYYQSPMLLKEKKFQFKSFKDSLSVYDSFFELLPEKLKQLNPSLKDFDFDVDLYGLKDLEANNVEYVLSTFPGDKIIRSYALKMKPHELNIVFDIQGKEIFLTSKRGIKKNVETIDNQFFIYYYRNMFRYKEIFKLLWYKLKRKLYSASSEWNK